jgi:hypothetical protein
LVFHRRKHDWRGHLHDSAESPPMKHLFPLMLVSMLITGCTTTRFVRIACLTPEQLEERRKAEPPLVGKDLTGRADEDIKPIAGSAVRLRAWGRGNLGLLEGCTG